MVAPCCEQVLTILKLNPSNTLVITEKNYMIWQEMKLAKKMKNDLINGNSVECHNQMRIKFNRQVK